MNSLSFLTDSLRNFPAEWEEELFQFMEIPIDNRPKQVQNLIQDFFRLRSKEYSPEQADQHIRKDYHRNHLATAGKLVRSFLAWKALTENPENMELLALGQLRKLEAEKAFSMVFNRLNKSLQRETRRDSDYYFLKFRLEDEANGMYGLKQTRIQDQHLSAKISALDEWYITTRMKESVEMQNRSRVLNQTFDDPYQTEFNALQEKAVVRSSSSELLNVYHLIRETLTHNLPEDVEALIDSLEKIPEMVGREEAKGIFKHAQNACIRQINAGRTAFQQVLLTLYRAQLDSGLLYTQGYLQHTDVKNIITVAIRLGQFEWAHSFLETYSSRIHPRYGETVYSFSKATILFEQGELRQAIHLLHNVTFTDVFYDLSARHLLLRMYVQLEDWEGAGYGIQAFEVFIRRNKQIPGQNRQALQNFVRIYKKLINWKEKEAYDSGQVNEKRRQKLIYLLRGLDPIAQKEWMVQEIGGLL